MKDNITKVVIRYLTSNISLQVLNLISILLVMSSLSLEGYGKFSYVIEMMILVSLLPELGTRTFYVKILASAQRILDKSRDVLCLHSNLCLVSFFLILIISPALESEYFLTTLVGFGFLLTTVFIPYQAFSLASEHTLLVSLREQVQGGSKFVYILFGYLFFPEVEYFIFFPYFQAFCLSLFWFVCSKYYVLPKIKWAFELKISNVKRDFFELFPFTLLIAINMLYNKIDIYMLSLLDGVESVALYVASTKFIYPFMFISGVFMNAVFPRMVKDETRLEALNYALKYLPALGVLISLVLYLTSEYLFYFFDGGKYYDAIDAYRILVFYLPIVFSYGVLTNFLVSVGKIRFLVVLNLCGLYLNVTLNYFLIPSLSLTGAAFSTIACELLIFIVVFVFFRKNFSKGY